MKIGRYLLVIVLFLIFLGTFFFINKKSIFLVKKIEISSDININKKDFLKKINLKSGSYIWDYDIKNIKNNIERLIIFDKFKVSKRFPDTISIDLKIRDPLARISGNNGRVFFIDKKGIVFPSTKTSAILPLLITDQANTISVGKKLTGKYNEVLNLLWIMKTKYDIYYRSISQVDVEKNQEEYKYNFNFRTINKTITLKNYLNVENIIDANAIAKLTEWIDVNFAILPMVENGVFYKREE